MTDIFVYPYSKHSKSAAALADRLGCPVVGKTVQPCDIPRDKPVTIVVWGFGDFESWPYKQAKILNSGPSISNAVNKLLTFKLLSAGNVPTVPWTTDMQTARLWSLAGSRVCIRKLLEGKDGAGLTIANSTLEIEPAKLYTKFIPAKAEYRVNTTTKQSATVQRKVPILEKSNPDIKTTGGGYGFEMLSEKEIPVGIRPLAKQALEALGLDFGGIDIITGVDGKHYILEVNTAPELTPWAATKLADRIKDLI